jgi:Na+/H+-dicarboxylate symporter
MKAKVMLNPNLAILLGIVLGVVTGYCNPPLLQQIAGTFAELFINLLKLISGPIIFLSIFSTILGMKDLAEFKKIGVTLVKYTLLTTWIAATVALLFFLFFNPAHRVTEPSLLLGTEAEKGYLNYLVQIVPSNIIYPFSENAVISILFLSILFSAASLALPDAQRTTLHSVFSSLNALIMKVASWIVYLLPLAIWSFIALFMKELQNGLELTQIGLYLLTIISANLFQGFVVLPLFAKMKGVSPVKLAFSMFPALSLAFFSKSSSATLPLTIRCAEERAGIPKNLSNISFPICTAINMNGCAGFILVTVLFVSMTQGFHYSLLEMMGWTIIATIAAVGNAGVPMGCYFLASAFLVSMKVPLNMMAIILPFYTLLDMLETAINVWSDSCVVAVTDQELRG